MITAYGSVEAAVHALKLGANDYFSKPWDNEKLLIEIDRMIARRRLEYENTQLKRALKQRYSFPNIIGKSERMVRMLDLVGQVAPSRSTILITGETGTGKELVAKAIHANSPRADQMFVAVNSGSLPPDLLESTLFGHVKGAFTSAIQSKKGYFEVADRGTIFFDEIGTIGAETQIKLLRVIQEKEFTPLGSTDPMQGRRAHPRRHQCRPVAARQRRQVPRGPLLPAERHQHRAARRCASAKKTSRRWSTISSPITAARTSNSSTPRATRTLHFQPEAHAGPDGAQLARQCARAGKRGGARRGAGVRRHRSRWTCCPTLCCRPTASASIAAKARPLPADASLFEIVNDYERRIIIERLEQCNWSQTEAAESLHVPLSTLNQKIKRLDIKIRKKSEG